LSIGTGAGKVRIERSTERKTLQKTNGKQPSSSIMERRIFICKFIFALFDIFPVFCSFCRARAFCHIVDAELERAARRQK
jgi:hypothetical protein